MKRKIVVSIEARMTSTRLPGKVLKPCVGKPMLALLIERVKRSSLVDEIVVSTTVNKADDSIVACAGDNGVGSFRGSETDVVGRVVGAMRDAHADVVVHLTGDNPLIDPDIIDEVLRIYLYNKFDYVSNMLVRSYPIGLDTQVTSLPILEKSLAIAKDAPQHEHVCLSIYENRDIFSVFNLLAPPQLCRPDMRWTVDTQNDYEFMQAVFGNLYSKNRQFTSGDILAFLDTHPEIVQINKDIPQKKAR